MASVLNIEVTAEPKAYVIQSDEEAIAIAKELATEFLNSVNPPRHPWL